MVADLDPQGNLTVTFRSHEALPEDALSLRLFQRCPLRPYHISENLHLLWANGNYKVTTPEVQRANYCLHQLQAFGIITIRS